tara:strand:- start:121 stop:747 length:627 start_codon:yes stop_codon:yes gene_type:complete|eukprot:g9282.t1
MGNSGSNIQNEIFNMKFTSKQLQKRYQKYEKQSKKRRQEVKKAIEDGNMDIAKQYAQMAITDHKTGIKMLGLSSKLDAVAAKLESAQRMKQVSKQMASTVKGMEYAMKAMDVDKLTNTMSQFETMFDELDIKAEYMDQTMSGVQASTTPIDEVDQLMEQVASEHGLEIASAIDDMGVVGKTTAVDELSEEKEEENTEALRKLRAQLNA